MSKTPYQVQDLAATDQLLTPYVVLPYRTATTTVGAPATGVFHSTIIGRSKMVDLSKDLSVRMGIERIQVQSVMRVDGEMGPAGEAVFKPVNDKFDQMRFVGNWIVTTTTNGSKILSSPSFNITDYVEVTFYGTGLNLLTLYDGTVQNTAYSVDGGADVGNIHPASNSSIISGRNYIPNQVVPVASGLTLGLHTVKLRNNSASVDTHVAGFEILNEASTLQIAAGTALVNGTAASLSAASTSAYNSGFESGTLGTRGGRVVVYAKRDGTVGKAVTPTDAASLTFTSTSHANEEVIRNYFWREFGAGRTDDFSTLTTSASARAFTLDDGTTTLATSSAVANLSPIEAVSPRAAGFITFTFVGTGLDLLRYDDTNGGADTYEFRLDGTLIQTQTAGNTATRITKIVSGLPYGTHTLRIDRVSAVTWNPYIANFIVYGPKKPTIPAGAMELADYNVMADFVTNATAGQDTIATGVLRKFSTREAIYSGTWTANLNDGKIGGYELFSSTNPKYVEYTFLGTGFDVRGGSQTTGTITVAPVTLNGTALTSANFATAVSSSYGGYSFILAAGTLSQSVSTTQGSGFRVSGLSLAKYTLRIADSTANFIRIEAIDIITPIHVHKSNGPFVLQNTLSVGSQGINDGRKVGSQLSIPGNASQALAVTGNPTTTSTSFIAAPDMSISHFCKTGIMDISYCLQVNNSTVSSQPGVRIYVDGVAVGATHESNAVTAGYGFQIPDRVLVSVTPGWHQVVAMYKTTGGTVTLEGLNRDLIVIDAPRSVS